MSDEEIDGEPPDPGVVELRMPVTCASTYLVHWRVGDGERVQVGTVLFEADVDKATLDVESPAAGTLRWLVADDAAVGPGSLIGQIIV